MNRGFTLLEMLLSLALLSGLMLGLGRWMQGLRLLEEGTRGADWHWLADRALETVRLDLRAADFPGDPSRVVVESDTLKILGRHDAWVSYSFDSTRSELRSSAGTVALLGALAEAEFALDEEAGTVRVQLTPISGAVVEMEVKL